MKMTKLSRDVSSTILTSTSGLKFLISMLDATITLAARIMTDSCLFSAESPSPARSIATQLRGTTRKTDQTPGWSSTSPPPNSPNGKVPASSRSPKMKSSFLAAFQADSSKIAPSSTLQTTPCAKPHISQIWTSSLSRCPPSESETGQ